MNKIKIYWNKVCNFFINITNYCIEHSFWNVNLTCFLFFLVFRFSIVSISEVVIYNSIKFAIPIFFVPSIIYWICKLHPNWFEW